MGESKLKKKRKCRFCKATFLNIDAVQITMHSYVCRFEKALGVEVIDMGNSGSDVEVAEN